MSTSHEHRNFWLAVALLLSTNSLAVRADDVSSALDAPQLRQLARDHYMQQRGAEFLQVAEKYLALVPADGEVWYYLGMTHLQQNSRDQALRGFREAHALGYRPLSSLYNTACALAKAGETDAALEALDRALKAGFVTEPEHLRTDADLDSIRTHQRFNQITRLEVPADLSRDDKWRYDIDYFKDRIEQVHFHPFRVMTRDWFERAIRDLKAGVPTLSDHDLLMRLQIILAAIGDGHTELHPPFEQLTVLPLRFYEYADGVHVQATTDEHRALAGARLLRIGSAPVEDALRAIRPMISHDNEQGVRLQAPRLLSYAEVLRYFGLAEKKSTIPVVLRLASGEERTVELSPVPALPEVQWVFARKTGDDTALYLRHREKILCFEHLQPDNIAYLRLWGIRDGRDETVEQFAERAFSFIEKNDVAATVIDLRLNGGGNNYRNKPFMQRLLRCAPALQRGKLFVIADRMTFSAAMNLLADIEFWTDALVVGEPAGSRPNFVGESTTITLPYSGAAFSCSNLYHQHSYCNDFRTMIAPDLPANLTIADYLNNRDPSLEVIRAYLRAR